MKLSLTFLACALLPAQTSESQAPIPLEKQVLELRRMRLNSDFLVVQKRPTEASKVCETVLAKSIELNGSKWGKSQSGSSANRQGCG